MRAALRAALHPGAGVGTAVVFVFSYFLARGVLEQQHWPLAVRVPAALLPVPLFALLLWTIVRGVQQLDELEQRIQLLALAVAFPLTLLLLMALGLLELAVTLPKDDLSYRHVWAIVPVFYFFGLILARRRYQ